MSSKQLNGDQAKFEEEYTLGKEVPINVVVHSVEYSVSRVINGEQIEFPAANEKLLLVRMTLRNPQPTETIIRYDTFQYTAVDSNNTNHDCEQVVICDGKPLNMSVKPAQKVDAFAVIKIPAKGSIPKLIIKSTDNLVLRYDLTGGKIKQLPAAFADPSDTSGSTALAVVPAKLGTYYDLGIYDFLLEKFAYTTEPPKETELGEGNHYLVLYGSLKNGYPAQQFTRYDSFAPTITTTDGDDIAYENLMELAGRHEWVDLEMKPGQELKIRLYFEMGKDVTPKTFTMKGTEDPRAFAWDLSDLK
jgi:hypothetical protein